MLTGQDRTGCSSATARSADVGPGVPVPIPVPVLVLVPVLLPPMSVLPLSRLVSSNVSRSVLLGREPGLRVCCASKIYFRYLPGNLGTADRGWACP